MGVFSMFYGLYGNFWFPFLESMRGPVLFDVLSAQHYQWRFFSSQKLTYPEFDRTVFAAIPQKDMQSYLDGQGWERDRKNVTDMLDFLSRREPAQPFISYMFFESPHARYYFPEESVIRRPYLEDFNYATMDLQRDMPLIKNRYINSVHHLDSQFARIIDYLEQEKLLDNTVVIITGDHGEEFNEHGHWGHGSSFNDAQTRVPMVLWVPGTGNSVVEQMTSHLDIIPTLLPRLGVKNPASDYALGYDMLGTTRRTYTVTGHWHTMGFIAEDYEAVIAMGNAHLGSNEVTCLDDKPCGDPAQFYLAHQSDLVQVMKDIARFSKK
jgi:membrane-anchored protein YejM (alkaline phosphatase superfamily)